MGMVTVAVADDLNTWVWPPSVQALHDAGWLADGLARRGAHTFCDCTRAAATIAAHAIMQACFAGQ